MSIVRSRTVGDVETITETEPVTARDGPDGITLTIDPEASVHDAVRAAFALGWSAGYSASTTALAQAAVDAVRTALVEIAKGGAVGAALLLPRAKVVTRNEHGQIMKVTESVELEP